MFGKVYIKTTVIARSPRFGLQARPRTGCATRRSRNTAFTGRNLDCRVGFASSQ